MNLLRARILAGVLASGSAATAAPPAIEQCLSASEEGQAERAEGRYTSARKKLATCSDPACPLDVRRDCVARFNEVETSMPTVVFVVRDVTGDDLRDVVVSLDDAVITRRLDGKPVPVDPGDHRFRFERDGEVADAHLMIRAGERNRAVSVLLGRRAAPAQPDAARETKPPALAPRPLVGPVVLAGVAVAAVGTAAALWASGLGARADLENDPCAARGTCDGVPSIRARLILGDIAFGVGLTALAVGAWLWLRPASTARVSTALRF